MSDADGSAAGGGELEKFRACLSGSGIFLALSDRQLRYTWVYNSYPLFRSSEILGKSDPELGDDPGYRTLSALKRYVITTGERICEDVDFLVEGEPRRYQVDVRPHRHDEELVGVASAAFEVTQRARRHTSELEAVDDQLRTVSHDLRQPLNTISYAADIVARGQGESISMSALGEKIKASARSMSDTLEALLDLGALESGEAVLDTQRVRLIDVVREALQVGIRPDHAARVQLQGSNTATADVDVTRLRRAVINLVDNALKFSAPAPVAVEVRTLPSAAAIAVIDRGPGIAPADVDQLFDRYRASHTSKSKGGKGLGLYSARLIAEAHGGKCRVESTPGVGSTFIIELPAPTRDV